MLSGFRDLTVYKKSFDLAMNIFELTKRLPLEESFELTDQNRRYSQNNCSLLNFANCLLPVAS